MVSFRRISGNGTRELTFGQKKRILEEGHEVGAVGYSIGNKGYIGTGTHPGVIYASQDFWEFDPALK